MGDREVPHRDALFFLRGSAVFALPPASHRVRGVQLKAFLTVFCFKPGGVILPSVAYYAFLLLQPSFPSCDRGNAST